MDPVDFDNTLSLVFCEKDLSLEDVCGRLSNWSGLLLHRGYDHSSRIFYEGRIFALSLVIRRSKGENISIDICFGYGEEDMTAIRGCLLCCLLEVLYRRLEIKEARIFKQDKVLADYYTENRILYDRISNKPVIQPDHLIDLYSLIYND